MKCKERQVKLFLEILDGPAAPMIKLTLHALFNTNRSIVDLCPACEECQLRPARSAGYREELRDWVITAAVMKLRVEMVKESAPKRQRSETMIIGIWREIGSVGH